jgi:hypothetical protein
MLLLLLPLLPLLLLLLLLRILLRILPPLLPLPLLLSTQGESSFPGLVEEQLEAYRDGSLIALGEEAAGGTIGAWSGDG